MPLETWLAFFAAAWLISLSPGPGALSCMAAGQRHGFRRACWNILGLQLGVLLLVSVVALGLGAVLVASALLFDAIKWAGAAYLVWLGIQQWRAAPQALQVVATADGGRRQLVLRGFLVNASNPKGIVFMLAVLPQFIDPALPAWPQYAACAATLFFTDAVVMSGYTLLAARVLRLLREPAQQRMANRVFGGLFMAAGLALAGFRRS